MAILKALLGSPLRTNCNIGGRRAIKFMDLIDYHGK